MSHALDGIDYAAGHEHTIPFDDHVDTKELTHSNSPPQKGEVYLTASQQGSDQYEIDMDAHPDAPTAEELTTLRRVGGQVPWAAYTIGFVELCERFSYYGATAVFTNFIQQPLPDGSTTGAGHSGQSGALGLGQQASTGLTTFNSFFCYVTPLFGAWIADQYLGRYNTIMYAIVFALVGHLILVISAIPSVIVHPNGAVACFAIGIVIMACGTGGLKSNISPMIAEQYKEKIHVITTSKGERVIVDPVLTVSRMYMYFYLMINIGALIGQIGMVYAEKYVGFWLAYMLPTCMFLFCPIVMYICRNKYEKTSPTGSVVSKAFRVIGYCMSGRWTLNIWKLWKTMKRTDFWDTAKPSMIAGSRPAWMTYDDLWIDELRRAVKACAVFCFYPLYWLTYNQILNNLTSQAAVMKLDGVPNDVVNNLDPFALIIFIPIFDSYVYPAFERMGVRCTPIRKITLGFFFGTLAMIWACVIQYYIYKKSPCGHYPSSSSCTADPPSNITVWAQTGSYVLLAFSEIMASITGLEYAFTKAPKNMRSVVVSLFLFTSALGNAITEAFVSLSADPLLVWNYGTMAVLSFIGGIAFWICFRDLDKQETELNTLASSKYYGNELPDSEEKTEKF